MMTCQGLHCDNTARWKINDKRPIIPRWIAVCDDCEVLIGDYNLREYHYHRTIWGRKRKNENTTYSSNIT